MVGAGLSSNSIEACILEMESKPFKSASVTQSTETDLIPVSIGNLFRRIALNSPYRSGDSLRLYSFAIAACGQSPLQSMVDSCIQGLPVWLS